MALLADRSSTFYLDWFNHVWTIAHFGSFLRAHGEFPAVIHSQQAIGLSFPIFYGRWFYAAGGALSTVVGPDLAVRMIVLLVVAGQFWSVYRLFESYSLNKPIALAVACLVCWSIYPMTNLYNRGAITEFVAVCLLQMSICSLLSALVLTARRDQVLAALRSGFFFTLTALVHPITGTIGGLVLFFILAAIVTCQPGQRHLALGYLAAAGLGFVVLSPWLYVFMQFAQDLPINQMGPLQKYAFDTFLSRIAPFPFDGRTLRMSSNLSTPYLEAQIDMALAVFVGGIAIAFARRRTQESTLPQSAILFRRRVTSGRLTGVVAVGAVVIGLYLLLISVYPLPSLVVPILKNAQQGFRFITYVNVCLLLLALMATQWWAYRPCWRDAAVGFTAAALALSCSGALVKLVHGTVMREGSGPWDTTARRLSLPPTFYALRDYTSAAGATVESSAEAARVSVALPPIDGRDFGTVGAANITVDEDAIARTNIYLFPWNRVLVDGADAPRQYYTTPDDTRFTSVRISKGSHTIGYRFVPDPTWTFLNVVSVTTMGAWALGIWIVPLVTRRAMTVPVQSIAAVD